MNEPRYTIRNYRPDDFTGYVQLHVEAESLERAGYCTSLRTLCETLGRPNYFPEKDLFVAETGGRVIGYLNLTPEPGIGRVVLNCLIHPEHRRQGLATQLYGEAMHRASSLGAEVVQGCIPDGNDIARRWVSSLGFEFVHLFLEMRLPLSDAQPADSISDTITCRHLRLGEEGILAELQNRSFAGTWGYNPCTTEEIAYRVNLGDCCPEGIILVCEGDEPAGYCWTTIPVAGSIPATSREGRIHMIGVLPEKRASGLGKYALMAGISYLASRGIEAVELTVDSENTEACALYESVGFRTRSTTEWYEKRSPFAAPRMI